MTPTPHPPSLSPLFTTKKAQILDLLAIPDEDYTDKSSKGSVDAPIIDLIREINKIDGLVTTSSCSGRVSVFVEGEENRFPGLSGEDDGINGGDGGSDDVLVDGTAGSNGRVEGDEKDRSRKKKKVRGGPSGKGGGRWLFVSHDPVDLSASGAPLSASESKSSDKPAKQEGEGYFTRLCGLSRPSTQSLLHSQSTEVQGTTPGQIPRLVHLSFSPLILHVLTANLSSHARPLLSAAINAGFRESGVQSLSALSHNPQSQSDNHSSGLGTMVAIRTAGLSFETVIGVVKSSHDESGAEVEVMEAIVSEDYLAMCFNIVNERFRWNEGRKERLRAEIKEAFGRVEKLDNVDWEDKEVRRRRKREEGLRRREEIERQKVSKRDEVAGEEKETIADETVAVDDILNLKIN